MDTESKFEIGCHNCQHLQTELGEVAGGCFRHPEINWPDIDEIIICHDFKCRFELCSQPGFDELDKLFNGKFKNRMKPGLLFSYLPHGTLPHLTAYQFAGGVIASTRKQPGSK